MVNEIRFSGNVPIFNTDGQVAFCTETLCELDTSNDIDITFDSNMVDCSGCLNCTVCDCASIFNGNTFQLTFAGSSWTWTNGNQHISLICSAGTLVFTAQNDTSVGDICFSRSTTATPLPQTINNVWQDPSTTFPTGNCSTAFAHVCATQGQVTISVH